MIHVMPLGQVRSLWMRYNWNVILPVLYDTDSNERSPHANTIRVLCSLEELVVTQSKPGYIELKRDREIVWYMNNSIDQIKIWYKNFKGDFAAVRYTQ